MDFVRSHVDSTRPHSPPVGSSSLLTQPMPPLPPPNPPTSPNPRFAVPRGWQGRNRGCCSLQVSAPALLLPRPPPLPPSPRAALLCSHPVNHEWISLFGFCSFWVMTKGLSLSSRLREPCLLRQIPLVRCRSG